MRRWLLTILVMVMAAGCTPIPFRETRWVPLQHEDPSKVAETFRQRLPENFQLLNSVVFEYTWRNFLGIGHLDINRRDQTFHVACLNPMGVQLFELSGDRDQIVTQNVLAPLLEYGDLPSAVGNDIRRMYLDLVPATDASHWRGRDAVTFRQSAGEGQLEFLFAGEQRYLVEKRYYEQSELVWRVSYYEYLEQNGKIYPRGIILVNYRYGYQLTVRHKELYL